MSFKLCSRQLWYCSFSVLQALIYTAFFVFRLDELAVLRVCVHLYGVLLIKQKCTVFICHVYSSTQRPVHLNCFNLLLLCMH